MWINRWKQKVPLYLSVSADRIDIFSNKPSSLNTEAARNLQCHYWYMSMSWVSLDNCTPPSLFLLCSCSQCTWPFPNVLSVTWKAKAIRFLSNLPINMALILKGALEPTREEVKLVPEQFHRHFWGNGQGQTTLVTDHLKHVKRRQRQTSNISDYIHNLMFHRSSLLSYKRVLTRAGKESNMGYKPCLRSLQAWQLDTGHTKGCTVSL